MYTSWIDYGYIMYTSWIHYEINQVFAIFDGATSMPRFSLGVAQESGHRVWQEATMVGGSLASSVFYCNTF